jgi:hypothetical protein
MNKPIRIYADESVNVAIVEGLKRRGVKIWSARDVGKLGLRDEEQLVHLLHLSIGESIRRLKTIVETKSSDAMCNQIHFL